MKKLFPLALLSLSLLAHAQEGPLPTQALVRVESKGPVSLTPNDLIVEVDRMKNPPVSVNPVPPSSVQIAILIDDGLRVSVGREIPSLQSFITNLPQGTEIFIGYMANGRVIQVSYFTTDHASAAAKIRLPTGMPGISASPYFCLSDFIKNWPSEGANATPTTRKARFVLMLTDGVDPYNGSTSVLNQNSPNVERAQEDAQRAGVPVYSIYFGDAGIRGQRADFSGQNYLSQIADETGGTSLYQGSGNPVSMDPFLKEFQEAISNTYVVTFPAAGKGLVSFNVKTKVPHVKLRAPRQVRPGNLQ